MGLYITCHTKYNTIKRVFDGPYRWAQTLYIENRRESCANLFEAIALQTARRTLLIGDIIEKDKRHAIQI